MNTDPHNRVRGMALLESVTALFVAVVGLTGTLQMLQFSVDKIRAVEQYAIAGRVLQNELETLRAQPYESLVESERREFLSASPELEALPVADAYCVVRPGTVMPARIREVTVVIAWSTEHGRRAERRLTTLVARRSAP